MAGQLTAGLGGGGSIEIQEPGPTEEGEEPPPGSEAFRAEADAEFFDRTYLARSTDWRISEPTPSPAPFPLQVIPRVAFVINYNMVRDPDTGEWTPQNPFEGGGGGFVFDTVDFVDTGSATAPFRLADAPSMNGFLETTGSTFVTEMPADPSDGDVIVVIAAQGSSSDIRINAPDQANDFNNGAQSLIRVFGQDLAYWAYDGDTDSWIGNNLGPS